MNRARLTALTAMMAATALSGLALAVPALGTVTPACERDGVSLALHNFNPDRTSTVAWRVEGPAGSGVLVTGVTRVRGAQLLGVPVVNTVPLTVTITFGPDPVRDVRVANLAPCPAPVVVTPPPASTPPASTPPASTPQPVYGAAPPPFAPGPIGPIGPIGPMIAPPVTPVTPVTLPPPPPPPGGPGGPDRPPLTCARLKAGGASLTTLRKRGCIRLTRCPRGKVAVFRPKAGTWTVACVRISGRTSGTRVPAVTG